MSRILYFFYKNAQNYDACVKSLDTTCTAIEEEEDNRSHTKERCHQRQHGKNTDKKHKNHIREKEQNKKKNSMRRKSNNKNSGENKGQEKHGNNTNDGGQLDQTKHENVVVATNATTTGHSTSDNSKESQLQDNEGKGQQEVETAKTMAILRDINREFAAHLKESEA